MTPAQEMWARARMRQAQDGDQAAYVELLVMLTSEGRRYVRARLGSSSDVDDVVQDLLISVHRARHTYGGERGFSPWFYAIAHSRVVDALRRRHRRQVREVAVDPLPDTADDTRPAWAHVDVEAVHAALAALPPRQREVVAALKLRDEGVREIAERLGMSVAAVKVTAHRGYVALRRMLGGSDDTTR